MSQTVREKDEREKNPRRFVVVVAVRCHHMTYLPIIIIFVACKFSYETHFISIRAICRLCSVYLLMVLSSDFCDWHFRNHRVSLPSYFSLHFFSVFSFFTCFVRGTTNGIWTRGNDAKANKVKESTKRIRTIFEHYFTDQNDTNNTIFLWHCLLRLIYFEMRLSSILFELNILTFWIQAFKMKWNYNFLIISFWLHAAATAAAPSGRNENVLLISIWFHHFFFLFLY